MWYIIFIQNGSEVLILVNVYAKDDSKMMKPKFVNVINYQYNIECAYNWIDCAKKPSNCTVCKYNPTFSKINLVLSCVC